MEGLLMKLGSADWDELGLAWGVDADIRRLRIRTSTINAVLADAEARSIADEGLRRWLSDLREVVLDAEDVLDELQIEAALREGKKEKVPCYPRSMFSTLLFRNKMARKIKCIVKRFDEVAEERRRFHLAEGYTVVRQEEREEFSWRVEDTEFFGRNDDKEKVVEWLTRIDHDGRDVSVLPIVGVGGVGKTTLAQMVYNDRRIVRHFETRIWVCVGEDFDLEDIAKAMLKHVQEATSVSTLEGMHLLIRERVTNKLYLLILDDVWCEDRLKLERLMDMLSGSARGSKIVVTTRSNEVANIMGTTGCALKLTFLTDDECWMLFKHHAFGPGRAEESPILVEIGKDIIRRCGGLPLAAISLGRFMATKREKGEWLDIRNSEIRNLDGATGGILPTLLLSYDHLTPQLKRCFAYCAVFPKGYKIKKLRLIQLWIAQGFIQSNSDMNLEDIGTQNFNILLNMSFFQDEERDEFGNIESCKIHVLVHYFACSVAKDEYSLVKLDEELSLPQGCRHSSIIYHEGSSSSIVKIASEGNRLRSFFLLLFEGESPCLDDYVDFDDFKFSKEISNLTRLQALHLDCISKVNIINVLRELKYLRFLELSHIKVEAIPDSITDLRYLQILNLGRCEELKELPKSMILMDELRHLEMGYCPRLAGMPRGIGRLTNLQTLSLFRIGREESHASIAELHHLNQIKGDLSIDGLENVKDLNDGMEAILSSKAGLQSLQLEWRYANEASKSCIDVMENLQPHPNLKSLSIYNYGGSRFPNWLTNFPSLSLPNLVFLTLYSLPNCEILPPLGLLPSLKELVLFGMHALKKVGDELYAALALVVPSFPSLKRMSLRKAMNLEEWLVPERGAFPCLEYLEIAYCPELEILGVMPSLVMSNMESGRGRELGQQNQPPPSFMSLSHLLIHGCPRLAVLPGWIRGIVSLQSLTLGLCPRLAVLPGWLVDIVSLQSLTLGLCPNLRVLPDGIQHLSGLKHLTISHCRNLQMLPDGFQHLSGLEHLTIFGCPRLERRCEREKGDDWYKISHIPHLSIDYVTIK